jgi:hypothetical protein
MVFNEDCQLCSTSAFNQRLTKNKLLNEIIIRLLKEVHSYSENSSQKSLGNLQNVFSSNWGIPEKYKCHNRFIK